MTKIKKLNKILKGDIEEFSDKSAQWIQIDGKECSISFVFNRKGTKLKGIQIENNNNPGDLVANFKKINNVWI